MGDPSFDKDIMQHIDDVSRRVVDEAHEDCMAGRRKSVTQDELADEVLRRIPAELWEKVPHERILKALEDMGEL